MPRVTSPRPRPLQVARSLGRIVLSVFLALVAAFLLLVVGQRRMLFPAPRGPWPSLPPTEMRQVRLNVAGDSIDAWFLPTRTEGAPHPAILFAHGNAERAEEWISEMQMLRRAGVAVLLLEYPGYGASGGRPTEASLTAAALAGYDWLRTEPTVDPARIAAYGRSLGGGVATRLATRRPVAALVLESAFTSVAAIARGALLPGFLVFDRFDNLAELSRYRGPLLVIHGERDAVVPLAHGQALAAAVPGAEFVPLPCGHNDCERPWERVATFVSRPPVATRTVP